MDVAQFSGLVVNAAMVATGLLIAYALWEMNSARNRLRKQDRMRKLERLIHE